MKINIISLHLFLQSGAETNAVEDSLSKNSRGRISCNESRGGVGGVENAIVRRLQSLFTRENLILKKLSEWLYVTSDIKVDFNGMKLLS